MQMLGRERRILILLRDDFKCTKCGVGGRNSDYILEVHHINPKSLGGLDDESNLTTLCIACHDTIHYGKPVRPATFALRKLARLAKRGD